VQHYGEEEIQNRLFQIATAEGAKSFEQILDGILALDDADRFTDDDPEAPFRIDLITRRSDRWFADLSKLRMNEDLMKATKRGNRKKVDMNVDEGLCEGTAFLYHPRTRTLAFHENKNGGTLNQVARVFNSFSKDSPIALRPIMKEQTLERVQRIRPYFFEIQLAGVDNGRPFRGRGEAAENIFRMLNFWRAPKAQIRVEIPKPRRKFETRATLDHIVDTVQSLVGASTTSIPEEVQRIVIKGMDPQTDQEAEAVINLLNDRLVEEIEIDLRNRKRATDADRHRVVNQAFDQNKLYLESYYSKG